MTKSLFAILFPCAAVAALALAWTDPGPAPAAAPATPVVKAAAQPDGPNGGASYVGADQCKKCHIKQYKTWQEEKHASAWEALPEKYRDPEQKDESGRACMSCHVTGFGHDDMGGFKDAASSENLLGVQCEACHGPGSNHMEAGKNLLKERRKSFNEGEETFIVRKTAACSDCHNPHISHAQYKEG